MLRFFYRPRVPMERSVHARANYVRARNIHHARLIVGKAVSLPPPEEEKWECVVSWEVEAYFG
jgi:hypothetical protein